MPTVKNGNAKKVISGKIVSSKKGLTISRTAKVTKEPKTVLYLKEGIKGKNLVSAKIDTNNAIKTERKSISKCINEVLTLNAGFLDSFVNYQQTDITPKNLLPMLKENEGKNGFNPWLVMQLITRYYKNI